LGFIPWSAVMRKAEYGSSHRCFLKQIIQHSHMFERPGIIWCPHVHGVIRCLNVKKTDIRAFFQEVDSDCPEPVVYSALYIDGGVPYRDNTSGVGSSASTANLVFLPTNFKVLALHVRRAERTPTWRKWSKMVGTRMKEGSSRN